MNLRSVENDNDNEFEYRNKSFDEYEKELSKIAQFANKIRNQPKDILKTKAIFEWLKFTKLRIESILEKSIYWSDIYKYTPIMDAISDYEKFNSMYARLINFAKVWKFEELPGFSYELKYIQFWKKVELKEIELNKYIKEKSELL